MSKIGTIEAQTYEASVAHAHSCGEAMHVILNKNMYANLQIRDARIYGLLYEMQILIGTTAKDIEETFRNAAIANGEDVGKIDASFKSERKIQQAFRERDQEITKIERSQIPIDDRPRLFRNDLRIDVDYIEKRLRSIYEIVSDSTAFDRQWVEVVARLEQILPVLKNSIEWMDTR